MNNKVWESLIGSGIKNDATLPLWIYKVENLVVKDQRYLKVYLFKNQEISGVIASVTIEHEGEIYTAKEFKPVSEFNDPDIKGALFKIPMDKESAEVKIKSCIIGVENFESAGELTEYTEEDNKERLAEEEAEAKAKKKKVAIIVSSLVAAAIIIAGAVIGVPKIKIATKYKNAVKQYEAGAYILAAEEFEELGYYKDSRVRYNDSMLAAAEMLYEQGDYEHALDCVDELDMGYDAGEIYNKCEYKLALALLDEKDYDDAAEAFTELGDYEDSREKAKEAKYAYVKANYNKNNSTTKQYLSDLQKDKYKDSASLYKKLFAWTVTNECINTSQYDTSSNMVAIPYYYTVYYHFKISGGNGSMVPSYTVTYPDGQSSTKSFNQSVSSGWDGWISATMGGSNTGTLIFEIFDASGNKIGSSSVLITE